MESLGKALSVAGPAAGPGSGPGLGVGPFAGPLVGPLSGAPTSPGPLTGALAGPIASPLALPRPPSPLSRRPAEPRLNCRLKAGRQSHYYYLSIFYCCSACKCVVEAGTGSWPRSHATPRLQCMCLLPLLVVVGDGGGGAGGRACMMWCSLVLYLVLLFLYLYIFALPHAAQLTRRYTAPFRPSCLSHSRRVEVLL